MSLVAPGFSRDLEIQRLRTLYHLLSSLTRAKSLEDVYDSALTSLLSSSIADRAAILLFDDDGVIRFKAWRGLSPDYRAAVTGHSPWPKGFSNAEPIPVTDVGLDPSLAAYHGLLARENIRSLVFIPLALDDGVFGKFMVYRSEPHEWTADEVAAAQMIAGHVALVLERKRAEMERERSERLLASVVQNSRDPIITKDLSGIITSWNRAAEELLGYTAAEAVGQSITMIAPAERIPEIAQLLTRIGKGERIAHIETQRKTKDGRILDVSLTISPIRDREGNIVGASKMMRDVTERKRAERERVLLLEREQHARATAELLNQVGPILVTEHDPARLVQAITDIASALVGADYGCFVHNAVEQVDQGRAPQMIRTGLHKTPATFPPAAASELAARTLRAGQVVRLSDLSQDPQLAGPQPGDTEIIRSYLAAPVVLRSGEILGALFFGHSTANKFAEHEEDLARGIAAQAAIALDNARLFEQAQWAQEELKRSNEELRRTNEDLEAFVYSASHDLKEPLRTITLCSELVQRAAGDQLPQEAAGFLAGAIHGARTMDQLIKDLLAYTTAARSTEGPPPVIDSGAVFREVLEALKASIDQAGARVTSAALPQVSMHPARLSQLLQNLISNALKYRGSEAPHIHVSAAEKDGWIVFSVEDNGIGIEPADADRIFGLFKRLHSREQYPGSGLGLAICQRIVEHYGGRIWLDKSTVGSGSVFCFSVPIRGGKPLPQK